MRIEGIDHIALAVSDVARSVRWYCEVLGMERRHQEAWGDHPAIVGAGTTALALFPAHADAPRAKASRAELGFMHLAFRVDAAGFRRAQEELERRGISCVHSDHGISHSVYFHDPDGNELEITTYEV